MSNPYAPPGDQSPAEPPPVSRDSLAALLQSFLSGEITAFQFDDRLDPYRSSPDPVIHCVLDSIWYLYDDCDDHYVCLSKSEWDLTQRLLLALKSDCRVESSFRRHWSWRQFPAALALAGFVYCVIQTGWGQHLFIFAVPFGLISMVLAQWKKPAKNTDPYAAIIYPFATFRDLANAFHSSGFRKAKYPKVLGRQTIRSPAMSIFLILYAGVMWLILAPIPLIFQALPSLERDCRVVSAQDKQEMRQIILA